MIHQILDMYIDRKDFFIDLTIQHLEISMTAIIIAAILGLILGVIISHYEKSSSFVLGVVNFIYTIPSISLLGFLIPFSGIGNTTAIIALTIYGLLPMVRSTYTGIKNIDPAIIEAAEGMGSTKFQILYKVKLPLSAPVIMSGLRNMVVMTIALTGIASFIGAGGLGVAIYRGITTNNEAMTMAGSILIAVLALVLDTILGIIERSLNRKSNKKYKFKRKVIYIISSILILGIIITSVLNIKAEKDTIKIATKPMTEQYIIGEMMSSLIENETDLKVELTQGVGGGTSNIQPAMEKGEFDIYPEYTGTGWNNVLNKKGIYNESMFNELQKEYNKIYKFQWLGMYGFNNTYGLAIRKEIADKYNIKTYSDLAKYSKNLVFGAEYDFYEREDGFDALSKTYGLKFKKNVDLDIGLKYNAIKNKDIDVMNIFTTDGQLNTSDIVVLEDDKNFYPSYMCGNVVREEVIDKYPEIKEVLLELNNKLDNKEMSKLNYEVEVEGKEPKAVAKEFLTEKGLLK
ncbi:glycine betaine ABC transporter substrate-binding protein [Clostridium sardiniense]|uniref:ABC transporter permease/substrate-binding protein n=1 Tax=Clostridium sardiniense TaxID=29369 RepID=UPI003D351A08